MGGLGGLGAVQGVVALPLGLDWLWPPCGEPGVRPSVGPWCEALQVGVEVELNGHFRPDTTSLTAGSFWSFFSACINMFFVLGLMIYIGGTK